MRSRDVFDALDRVSDRLGRGWSPNGDFLTLAIHRDRPVSPMRGPTVAGAISFLDGSIGDRKFFVEDGGFPEVIGDIVREVARRDPLLSSSVAAFGKLLGVQAPLDCIMPWFGQAMDASDGTLRLRRRNAQTGHWTLDLDWNPEASRPVLDALAAVHRELGRVTGGTPDVPPGWTLAKYLISPHPLGGARMADSAAEGVVDQRGEVFGHPGLFVVDGAAIPRPIGLNPSRTIAAVAEWIATHRLAS